MGLVHNFSGLLACRVFLGAAEGGLFPGISYYITMWYRRHECGFRIALFFSAATIAGAFGGILAFAIAKMSGVGGKAGWVRIPHLLSAYFNKPSARHISSLLEILVLMTSYANKMRSRGSSFWKDFSPWLLAVFHSW